jgi:hypothetical protein
MGRLGLLFVVLITACASSNDAKLDPLSDYGSGEYVWLPEEENTCVVKYVDVSDAKYQRFHMAEKTKRRCDQIAGVNFFPIESIKDKSTYVQFINTFRDWLKQQRALKLEQQNELAECIIKDRSTFVYSVDLGTNAKLSLLGASLDFKSRSCASGTAEVTLWPDGRVSVNVIPMFISPDPLE